MTSAQKSKWIVGTFVMVVVVSLISSFVALKTTKAEHEQKIEQVIAARGGSVVGIDVVPITESPFQQGGKGNTIYKVTYVKGGKRLVAWYRADNHSSIVKEKEAWIIRE